uniref:PDZ domain-containing protein n=1 Tax=Anopheles merus TaxID=30066 RepID=A0A182V2T3_ANOME
MQQRTTTPAAGPPPPTASSSGKQVVELNGYVIILVESRDGKIKLYGSPADKDNLEVADEILDVNERKLEDSPRAEVIKHIHEMALRTIVIVIDVSEAGLEMPFS